jgi:hypothetical protein
LEEKVCGCGINSHWDDFRQSYFAERGVIKINTGSHNANIDTGI